MPSFGGSSPDPLCLRAPQKLSTGVSVFPTNPVFSLTQLQSEGREGDLRPGKQALGAEVPEELSSQLLLHPQLAEWLEAELGVSSIGAGHLEGDPFSEVAAGQLIGDIQPITL